MGVGNWMSRDLAGSSRHRADTVSGDPLRRLMPRSWKHRSGNDTGCLASYYKVHMMIGKKRLAGIRGLVTVN